MGGGGRGRSVAIGDPPAPTSAWPSESGRQPRHQSRHTVNHNAEFSDESNPQAERPRRASDRMSRYSSPGYSAAELTAAVRERGREAVSWLMAGEDAGPPPGLVVDPTGNYSASPAALAAARARRTGDGTGELRPPSSAAKEELTSRGVKQQQRLKSAVTKVAAASAFANSRDDARTNSRSTPTRKGTGHPTRRPHTPGRPPGPPRRAPPHTTDRHRAGRSPRRNHRASAPRPGPQPRQHRKSGPIIPNREWGAQSKTTLLRPRFEPRRPHPGERRRGSDAPARASSTRA